LAKKKPNKGRGSARSGVPARVETARIAARSEVIIAAIPWVGRTGMVAAAYFPLQALQPMVEDLAGQTTHVNASISLSVAISVFLGGTYFVQRRKLRQQREELERLRGRLEEIDASRVPSLPEGGER
jgi:hypothetical protein